MGSLPYIESGGAGEEARDVFDSGLSDREIERAASTHCELEHRPQVFQITHRLPRLVECPAWLTVVEVVSKVARKGSGRSDFPRGGTLATTTRHSSGLKRKIQRGTVKPCRPCPPRTKAPAILAATNSSIWRGTYGLWTGHRRLESRQRETALRTTTLAARLIVHTLAGWNKPICLPS